MTNKEAIEVLNKHLHFYKINDCTTDAEAVSLAIKALEERPQGKWLPTIIDTRLFERSVCREWQCSNCGEVVNMKYPFCHCGAKMDVYNK